VRCVARPPLVAGALFISATIWYVYTSLKMIGAGAMVTLPKAAERIQQFEKGALTSRIGDIEASLQGLDRTGCEEAFRALVVSPDLLESALVLKKAAGQVNVLIHAIGILLSLPHILRPGESIESLSLGAGNTGRPFDLETSLRIAEFKFIQWRGGPESIRQNSLFKDFYLLAEYDSNKEKYLYVLGTEHPLHFLNGGRVLSSVMSRNNKLWTSFRQTYGDRFSRVNEYYEYRKAAVMLINLAEILPQLVMNVSSSVDSNDL
jgi:hypothetical protein